MVSPQCNVFCHSEERVPRTYKPFLFFVVFGARGDQLEVSGSRHHVEGMPEGLEFNCLNRSEHADYIDGFFEGPLGDILQEENSDLLARCREAEDCVVIQGEIAEDDKLDYMRDVIGIGKAFFEQGAAGILDMLTFTLYPDEEWTERFFEKDVNAQNHVKILLSEDDGRCWIHTRGILEFGRPDLSLYADDGSVDEYIQIINQMKKGNADAMNDLGAQYYDGNRGFEQSFEKSVRYYNMAAENGNRQAQENLGYCYYYGRVGEPDYEKAFHYFALGAFDGHLISLYKIGDMYLNGLYVPKNEKEAFFIFMRCIETMTEEAEGRVAGPVYLRLGRIFLEGLGVEQNLKNALICFQKAEAFLYDIDTS